MGIFDRYPAIYFDAKGKCYLAFGCRRTGMFKAIGESFGDNFAPDILDTLYPSEKMNVENTENGKKKRESKFSQTIKTIPISFEEATYFMEKHPFAEQIKRGSIDLNAVIHGQHDRYNLDAPEKLETFNTVHMHAELYSQTEKNSQTKKEKRMKL